MAEESPKLESPEFQSSVVFLTEKDFLDTRSRAVQGNPAAQVKLGEYYEIVIRDKSEGLKWYERAAEQGHIGAQCILGTIHWAEKSYREALIWFRKAAEQGEISSLFYLGCIYYNGGDGISRNLPIAAKWFRKAAEQGNPQAQVILAGMYWEGFGIERNYAEAYALFNLAAADGDDHSAKQRDDLEPVINFL